MATTIRNPIEWSADQLKGAAEYLEDAGANLGSKEAEHAVELLQIRRIDISDLRSALRKGIEDFGACRTDVALLCIVYPIVGIILT